MRTTGDENDIVPGLNEPCADDSADAAGAVDDELQRTTSVLGRSGLASG
jgi:hypothetical protein